MDAAPGADQGGDLRGDSSARSLRAFYAGGNNPTLTLT